MQGLLEFAKTLGGARIAAMVAVTVALVGFFAFVIMRVTTPQMTPLFTDLTLEDSAAIAKELDREGVTYQLRNDGNIIMVPTDRVARLRITLTENGLPKGGGVGYEIFDKSDALGTTSFVQNINSLRALEGELARSIQGLDRVEAARVHLVMPERPLFSRDRVDPSASIVLKVRGTLDAAQVRAIRHLVATAVNGLSPQRISIIDEQGQLLADGAADAITGSDVSADERQAAYEKHLRQQVEAIVSSVVGPGHSRVQVSADFDFNRITQTSDNNDPEGRVIRSSQTREETTASADGNQQVTVGNELPGTNQKPPPAADSGPHDQSRKSEEIVNYEISKTTKTEVIEGGRVNRVSVAVLVDGTYGKDDKGDVTYQPRSKDELDQIGTLVRSAIGFNQNRGDEVEVVNLRFAETPALTIREPTGWLDAMKFTKDDIMRAIEMVVMGVLGLVVLLLVVRPLVRRIVTPEEPKALTAQGGETLMFTFDDLTKLDTGSAQTLMRHVEKDKLGIALKGAAEPVRQFFLNNMSSRAAKMLLDDMQAMGPVRLRDVDEAQGLLVNLAKDLAAKGEIVISKSRSEEELIY
ncbi:MAG TPA: flagellar basal-body MS-ring/collar protein FliF [Xanthobacteraceae bacterium]|nr:flagellar basal-body MS-ring/collar protein FliF [Xanthobacteraceae bacterium]